MRSYNELVIKNETAVASSIAGMTVDCRNCRLASLHIVTGGTSTGTVSLQASNDEVDNISLVKNWTDISGTLTNCTPGVYALVVPQTICYQYIRAFYKETSGTGPVNATLHLIGY